MASVPPVLVDPSPTRPPGGDRVPASPDNRELDEERGRVEEEAILGKLELPLRELLLGAPDARFLRKF